MDIDLQEFIDAKKRISGFLHHTPLEYSETFSKMCGTDVYLKLENEQKTGSFKIRGASNKIAKMVERGDLSPVIASSAGNHAQGVACAATKFGIKSTVVMPSGAPIAKVQATKNYGADVVLFGDCYDDAFGKACVLCESSGARFLHPYDDLDVIAGQGTVGIEILDDLKDADVILTPAGGGGLLSGVACAAKKINPNVKVYGVQAEGADALVKSYEAKRKIITESADTIADGIAVKNPGDITFELISKYVDGMLTVSDDSIANAILLLLERSKHLVEAAGATTVAAALDHKEMFKGKKVVCVLSGGNIDASLIGKIIDRGLSIRYRMIELYIVLPDKNGETKKLIDRISELGGNVINMVQDDTAGFIRPNQASYSITINTADLDHKMKIINSLIDDGYEVYDSDDFISIYKTLSNNRYKNK